MECWSRRSIICSIGIALTTGCVDLSDSPNGSNISDIYTANQTRFDGTLSKTGYIKFIERKNEDKIIIKQTFVNTSCRSSEINVSPDKGATNGDPIILTAKNRNKDDKNECSNTSKKPTSETGISIEFVELKPGQKIIFEYNSISASYTTINQNTTAVREPIDVPDNIRL